MELLDTMLGPMRYRIQALVKRGFAHAGLHVRYGFQYPQALGPKVVGRFFEDVGDVRTVFDVGANIGQTAEQLVADYPNAQVLAFEPFTAIYNELVSRTGPHDRIRTFPLAMGADPGVVKAWFDGDAQSQMNRIGAEPPATGGQVTESLSVTTIDAFCLEQGIEQIDLLKTDTEGYDAKVLSGASGLLEAGKVRVVVSEAGFLDDPVHTPFEALHRHLSQYDFEVGGVYELSYRPDGGCDYCNVLFVHRSALAHQSVRRSPDQDTGRSTR